MESALALDVFNGHTQLWATVPESPAASSLATAQKRPGGVSPASRRSALSGTPDLLVTPTPPTSPPTPPPTPPHTARVPGDDTWKAEMRAKAKLLITVIASEASPCPNDVEGFRDLSHQMETMGKTSNYEWYTSAIMWYDKHAAGLKAPPTPRPPGWSPTSSPVDFLLEALIQYGLRPLWETTRGKPLQRTLKPQQFLNWLHGHGLLLYASAAAAALDLYRRRLECTRDTARNMLSRNTTGGGGGKASRNSNSNSKASKGGRKSPARGGGRRCFPVAPPRDSGSDDSDLSDGGSPSPSVDATADPLPAVTGRMFSASKQTRLTCGKSKSPAAKKRRGGAQ